MMLPCLSPPRQGFQQFFISSFGDSGWFEKKYLGDSHALFRLTMVAYCLGRAALLSAFCDTSKFWCFIQLNSNFISAAYRRLWTVIPSIECSACYHHHLCDRILLPSYNHCVQQKPLYRWFFRCNMALCGSNGVDFLQNIWSKADTSDTLLSRDYPSTIRRSDSCSIGSKRYLDLLRHHFSNLQYISHLRFWYGFQEKTRGHSLRCVVTNCWIQDRFARKSTLLPVREPFLLFRKKRVLITTAKNRIIVISKATLLVLVSIDEERYIMLLICHLVLTIILVSRVYRELIQIRIYPDQRDGTEFLTGNMTSAEFAPNFSASLHQNISKMPTELQGSTIATVGSSRQTESSSGKCYISRTWAVG